MLRILICAASLLACSTGSASAAADRVRISHGYGTIFLPVMIMHDRKLLERHAEAQGLGRIAVEWQSLDGGNNINDAMLAGTLDIGSVGIPGFLALWSKTRAIPSSAVIGLSALSNGSQWLNTNRAEIRSLRDFAAGDRIALPGIKTSFAAIALQMLAAKEFGIESYSKLDPLTVGIPHPEAYAALTSGRTEITAHFASPPFSYKELDDPKIHRVLSTREEIGPLTLAMTCALSRFVDANPRLIDAFLAAQVEANELIASDKEAAAEIYIRVSGLKVAHDDLIRMLKDPENTYALEPAGTMLFADFMMRAGIIKTTPASWNDVFVPALRGRPGS